MRAQLEHLKALGIHFSAVTLAITQFVRHGIPAPDIVLVTPVVVIAVLSIAILAPALGLFVADRLLSARDASGTTLRRFRTAVFAGAMVLAVREMQLYFDPVGDALAPVSSPAALGLLAAAVMLGAAVYVARVGYEQLTQFFVWTVPVSLVVLLYAAVQMVSPYLPPAGYAAETETRSDAPPVFVFVFDELSYYAVADGDWVDEDRMPNIAKLADDSVWLTNATTNYFHTTFSVPSLFDPVLALTDDYQVRLYTQYGYVESLMDEGCGEQYTCRGAAHLARGHTGSLIGNLLVRSVYQMAPGLAESMAGAPLGALADATSPARPTVDPLGMHTFTEAQWDEFMGDVSADAAPGRLYFVHVLVPHEPFVFDGDRRVTRSATNTTYYVDDADANAVYARYQAQTQFVDSLMGDFTRKLKDQGLYEEATIILTGDHGLRKDRLTGPIAIDQETAQVPLMIKAPGIAPGVLDVDYQHVDFARTLFDVLGTATPNEFAGVSAFASSRPQRDKVLYTDLDNERYWEYVYQPGSGEWLMVREVDGPLPETPDLAVRSITAGD